MTEVHGGTGSSSPTLGELHRTMQSLRDDLRSTQVELRRIADVRTDIAVARTHLDEHRDRLDELEASLRWVVRLVLGAVIAAALTALVLTGGA